MAYQITIQPSGHRFTAETGQTILEAAAVAGFTLPYACRNGSCGACEGLILKGQIDYGDHQESLLTEDDKERGLALFCSARPLSDLTIEANEITPIQDIPVRTLACRIERMENLCHDVLGISLGLPDNERLRFLPGQYIDILLEGDRYRSYSLANSPEEAGPLELHVRRVPGGFFSERLINGLEVNDTLHIKGPLGTFFLRDSDKPAIFLAGGTGFAPIKSILSHALRQGNRRRIWLYWGVRQLRDLYMSGLPEQWQQEHEGFTFVPVLSDATAADGWQGRTGFVHEAVLEDFADLSGHQIYACGAPALIEAARRDFVARGLPPEELFCDAFSFQQSVSGRSDRAQPETATTE